MCYNISKAAFVWTNVHHPYYHVSIKSSIVFFFLLHFQLFPFLFAFYQDCSVMLLSLLGSFFSYLSLSARISFSVLLLFSAVSDAKHRMVPSLLQKGCVVFAVAGSFDPNPRFFLLRVLAAALCFLILFSVYRLSQGRGFGGADVKIISLSVLVFGFFNTAKALLWGCCLGLYYGIERARPLNSKNDGIPVITFFVIGVVLYYVFI